MPTILEPEKISLENNQNITEAMIQKTIAENPSILGLGDLVLLDRERIQPRAGRLDLLLQDPDTQRRYEVEIQLGKTDESHIIRTIEYWDTERKRYPQYDHCAVIVAEDITSRFSNVIGLFNGHIPVIAVKMSAINLGEDRVGLLFTTVLDELTLGLVDDDEEIRETTDRNYWIHRGSDETVKIADYLLGCITEFAPGYELKYNKFYIGLAKDGQPNNFVSFRPRRNSWIRVEIKLPFTPEVQKIIEDNELDDMGYDKGWGLYRLRLTQQNATEKIALLKDLFLRAYNHSLR